MLFITKIKQTIIMFNFQSQMSPGFLSRIDQSVRTEFETAQARVRVPPTDASRVEEAMATIQNCFSERTRTNHTAAVDLFLQRAHSFLISSSSETAEREQSVARLALSQAKPIEECRSPLQEGQRTAAAESPQRSKQLAEGESVDSPPKLPQPLSPYLSICLKIFASSVTGTVLRREEVAMHCDNRLRALGEWCSAYRRKELLKSRCAEEVDLEVQQFEQEARARITEERAKNEEICDRFEHIRPTIARLMGKPTIGPVTLEIMQKMLWVQPWLMLIQQTRNTPRLFGDFFSQIGKMPLLQPLWQDLIGPLLVHAGSQSFEIGLDALVEFVQGHNQAGNGGATGQFFRALEVSSLPNEIRLQLLQGAARLDSELRKPLYGILSPEADRILSQLDRPTAQALFGIGSSAQKIPPHLVSCILEDTAQLLGYITKNAGLQLAPEAISIIALAAAECAKLQILCTGFVSVFLAMSCLPNEELSSCLRQIAEGPSPARLLLLRILSSSDERFQRVKTLFQKFSPMKGPLESDDLFLCTEVQSRSISELDDLLFCLQKKFFKEKYPLASGLRMDKQCLNFLRRTYRPTLNEEKSLAWLLDLYDLFKRPDAMFPTTYESAIFMIFSSLTGEEKAIYARRAHKLNSLEYFCALEGSEHFEPAISSVLLSEVPTEPLIRFLSSKPFPEMALWLREKISVMGVHLPRCATMTPAQLRAMLLRFPSSDSHLPRKPLLEVLGLRDEEAQALCHIEEKPLTAELTEFHTQLQNKINPYDPHSLLHYMLQLNSSILGATMDLLVNARVEILCGGRVFLTWGNVPATSSPCVSQDDISLHARYNGQSIIAHLRGLFNDPGFGVSAYMLRERLFALKQMHPVDYARLGAEECLLASANLYSQEAKELFFELHRIAGHIEEKYPSLFVQLVDYPAPVEDYGVDGSIRTFHEFLVSIHRHCIAYHREHHDFVYDGDRASHNHGLTLLSLLKVMRCAGIDRVGDVVRVSFSPTIHYQLKSLRREEVQILPEDNPGVDALSEVATDYPTHTLTAFTPREITPENFIAATRVIQALPEERFTALIRSCFDPRFLSENLEYATLRQGFEAWKQCWPSGVDISECSHVLVTLAEQYIGPINVGATTIRPNGRYHLNQDLNAFALQEQVPDFLKSQGNFASALCASFIPLDPYLHDGDCSVNSFLLGLARTPGERSAYLQESEMLDRDVREFRHDLVEWAQNHRQVLDEKFGVSEIDDFIQSYSLRDEGGPLSWSGPEAWWIAAQVYRRKIMVYNCDRTGNVFSLDEHCAINPTAVFGLDDGTFDEEPIHLANWSVHYCFLQPRLRAEAPPLAISPH